MNQRKPSPSFSVVQVAVAWLVGLALGAGVFALIAFRDHAWSGIFALPTAIGGLLTFITVGIFIVTHWNDHD